MKNFAYYLKQLYYLGIVFAGISITGIISYNIIKDNGVNVISILLLVVPYSINMFVVLYYYKLFVINKRNRANGNFENQKRRSYLSDFAKLMGKHELSDYEKLSNKYIENNLKSLDNLRKKYGDNWENKCRIDDIINTLDKIKYSDTQLYDDCLKVQEIINNMKYKLDNKINNML